MDKEQLEALKILGIIILYGWGFVALSCVIAAPFYLISLLFN